MRLQPKKLLLIFCSLSLSFFSLPLRAQEAAIDSLKRLLPTTEDTALVRLQTRLALSYQNYIPDSAMRYAESTLHLAEQLNDAKGKADAMLQIGRLKRYDGNFGGALEDMLVALALYQTIRDSVQIGNAYNDISIVYGISGDYPSSREYFHKALEIFRLSGDLQGESYALNNIGTIYEKEGQLDKAKEYYLKAMQIKLQRNDQYGIARGFNTLGNLAVQKRNYKEALSHMHKADSLFIVIQDKVARSTNLGEIANIYLDLKQPNKARAYARQSYAVAQELNSERALENALRILVKASSEQGDFEDAFRYQLQHEAIKDSLRKTTNEKHLAELKAEFDDEQQKTEIMLLKQDKQLQEASLTQQRTIIISLSISLLAILVFSIALYKSNRRNKQKNKLLAIKNEEIQAQSEELSRQKNHLSQLNRTKDKLFSIISHDIRSPLNTLKGFSYLLSEEIETMNQAERRQMSMHINKAVDNLNQLLDNLLNWSLMQTGNKKQEFERVDINDVIMQNIDLYEATAREKNIRLVNQSEEEVYAQADFQSVNTIIRNLLSNSIKFSYPDSSIYISARKMKETVEVAVMDQGIGMSDEVINKLFTIDKKASQKGTQNESGSGFGLTLCHELVRQNKGSFDVSSKLNEGSTFSIKLPKAAPQKEVNNV